MNGAIVSREEWTAARKQLLAREKELTKLQEEVSKERREMPWVKIDKEYVFDTPKGPRKLAELFDGRSQLIVYHFMFGPGWKAGCVGCSFLSDHVDGANQHLAHKDVTYVAISRAPLAELEAYKARMGWRFNWVSSFGTDFNYDFHVSFRKDDLAKGKVYYNYEMFETSMEDLHGTSVFFKDEDGTIFHTYSAYARGDERGLGTYMFLDLTPKGRNETGPNFNLTDWVQRHDEYDNDVSPTVR
jgi:predicted dithiol-disulfide oxidoreductase (DUF899 family)